MGRLGTCTIAAMEVPETWRASLQKALAPLLLTVLGTLVYQSAIVLKDSPEKLRLMTDQFEEQTLRAASNQREQTALRKIVETWGEKRKQRQAAFSHIMQTMMADRGFETYSGAVKNVSNVTGDLGKLQGFLDGDKTFTSGVAAAELSLLQAELRAWEVVRKYSDPDRDRKNEKRAIGELLAANIELTRATAYGAGALESEGLRLSDDGEKLEKMLADFKARVANHKRDYALVKVGFFGSTLAFTSLLLFVVWPTPKEGTKVEQKPS